MNDPRDRTAEFFSTVESLRAIHGSTPTSLPSSSSSSSSSTFSSSLGSSSSLLQKSHFSQAASHISKGIYQVTQKLQELGRLAKQRSLFNDPAQDINKLTYIIKSDIQTLNNEIDVLHDFVDGNRSNSNRQSDENSQAIVDNLKSELASTTKNFAEVLQIRTKNLKEQNTRRKQFESSTSSSSSLRSRNRTHGMIRNRHSGNHYSHMSIDDDDDDDFDEVTPLNTAFGDSKGRDGGGSREGDMLQQQQQQEMIQSGNELASRAQAVESIETIIVELGQMYTRLVNIVNMQEEVTLRIDENMDQTLHHVEQGHTQLLKYFDNVSSSQWLIMKIFAVLIIFSVFFIVFVA